MAGPPVGFQPYPTRPAPAPAPPPRRYPSSAGAGPGGDAPPPSNPNWWQAPGANYSTHVHLVQQQLRAMGYRVNVTGVMDQATRLAIATQQSGRGPSDIYGSAAAYTTPTVTPAAPTGVSPAGPAAYGAPPGPVYAQPNPSDRVPSFGISRQALQALMKPIGMPRGLSLSPQQYAALNARLTYGGPLADLQNQQQQIQGSVNPALANLAKWYGAAQGRASENAAADTTAAQQQGSQLQSLAQTLIGAFGGSANQGVGQSVAQNAQNQAAAAGQAAQGQSAFDRELAGNIGQQQAESSDAYQRMVANVLNTIGQQRQDLTRARGAQMAQDELVNYPGANQDLIGKKLSNASSLNAIDWSKILAGQQAESTVLQNVGTRQAIGQRAQTAADQRQSTMFNQWATTVSLGNQAQKNAITAAVNAAKATGKNPLTDPTAVGKIAGQALQPGFWGGPADSNGVGTILRVNPNKAFQRTLDTVRQYAPTNSDPRFIISVAKSIVDAAIAKSGNSYKFAGWRWASDHYAPSK